MKLSTSCGRTAKRVTLCRGGPACPPVLVGTWSAVYPAGGHAGPPLHELHQHDNTIHQTHTEGPRERSDES